MANRFQKNEYAQIYDFIVGRDGEYCIICAGECKRQLNGIKLQIDHADGVPNNNKPENLSLVCQYHNLQMRKLTPAEHKELIRKHRELNDRARSKKIGSSGTHHIKNMVDYRAGSPQMQANAQYEIRFREWILSEVGKSGYVIKDEAINSGAELTGASQRTITHYLAKLTSSLGPLRLTRDELGNQILEFKRK